jgi:hypothetical protein
LEEDSLAVREPDVAEQPTQAARLTIDSQPARLKITARRWLTAEGTVPPDEARHLIGAFGILACVTVGIAGAVLTLHISSGLTVLVLAELGLAFTGAVLIALCGRGPVRAGQKGARQKRS